MTAPLTTQTSFLAITGQLDQYRSGKTGQIRNDGDVRQINGFDIDVTGSVAKVAVPTNFKPASGIKAVTYDTPPPSGLLAPSTLAASMQLVQLQGYSNSGANWKEAMKAEGGSGYVTAVSVPKEMYFAPAGAEAQSVEGLGYLPGDVFQKGGKEGQIGYVKSQIARAGELAKIETQMKREYGADVKVAFDPLAEQYVMLRPGQTGYDQVMSANEVFDRVVQEDVRRVGNINDYRDVLAEYGIAV